MKYIFCLLFLIQTFSANALSDEKLYSICNLSNSNNFSFLSLTLSNTYNEVKDRLISLGFTQNKNGEFLGVHNGYEVRIGVWHKGNKINGLQFRYIENSKSWNELERVYYQLKQLLIGIYGNPAICNDGFKCEPFENEKMLESIESGEARYRACFKSQDENADLYILSFTYTQSGVIFEGKKYGEDIVTKSYYVRLDVYLND